MRSGNLTIFQINDTHAYLEPHPELVWTSAGDSYPTMGGYAQIASLLKAARREKPDSVLALDNGDTFHGTYPAISSRGEALIPLVNALELDAMTAHWEFAWGPEHFQDLAARLNHPVLAINCYDVATGDQLFPSSTVLERGGLRAGIVGIAATIIDESMPAHFSEGVRFTLGIDELPGEIARLRSTQAADVIIVLSHLGFPQDVKLANSVEGIDVLVSGHTHNRLEYPVRTENTLIIQSGCHGSFVGRMDLSIVNSKIGDVHHQLIPVHKSIPPDAAMQALIDEVMRPHRAMLDEVVGNTSIGLHRNANLYSPMDDVLLAAIARVADAEIAFSNGWRYGAPVPPGPVTMNDLWNIIPTNPPVSCVKLRGSEIWDMMEENLERTFSSDPFSQMGGYLKRFRGMTIYGKLENPAGHRIEHIFTQEGPVEGQRIYEVAFVSPQGVPKRFGHNRRDLPINAIAALQVYFQSCRPGSDPAVGRFLAS